MSNVASADDLGCAIVLLIIVLIICSTMCSRQAKELGYRNKEIIQPEIIDIKIYDSVADTLIYSYPQKAIK